MDWRIVICLLVVVCLGAGAPTTGPVGGVDSWVGELAAADPLKRDGAREKLLGLKAEELGALREAVVRMRPLLPSQRLVFREIVTHVFLTGEAYRPDAKQGFMGVTLGGQIVPLAGEAAAVEGEARGGVVVAGRIPGFCGYRSLMDGDIIFGIVEKPGIAFRDRRDLVSAVSQTAPGETIHFNVLRQGRLVKVGLTLNARPMGLDDQIQAQDFVQAREAKADRYWWEVFAPLVDEELL